MLTAKEIKKIVSTAKTVKVMSMKSRNGNPVPNQFILKIGDAIIFQSYNTVIAVKSCGRVLLDADSWDYSRTTGKYRNEFLCCNTAECRKRIKDGSFILANLN